MGYQSFKDLRVWQEAKALASLVYGQTASPQLAQDRHLSDQMRRSAVSVASNIAEGYERNGNREFVRFLYIAKGSLSELRTQIEIAHDAGKLSAAVFQELEVKCVKLGSMVTRLIQARRNLPRQQTN